ncbi:hypothetical protein SH1V18_38860 [Vallitalea longa]|uniref:Uncharacterized protein n=1 Tax=Vallitalea longa TaxID=2936439 RepID=A0A9W5YEU3_9FIRM|nr:hypothetical protein [Vallitalea longa]GKX31406.1 hypothetical protein SH1V18_38860 [Vallitalea longa]
MKINKKTSIICIIISIIFGTLTFILQQCNELSLSIVASIFASFIVSTVVALIGYFHEREKILNDINDNMRSLYINLLAIKDIMGKIVPEVASITDLRELDYNIIESLASLNIEFMQKMGLEYYNGFSKSSKLPEIINELISFKKEQYKLKYLVTNLYKDTLNYELNEFKIKNVRLQGTKIPTDSVSNQTDYKNFINIKTAKLHEYVAGLIIQLNKLAEEFNKCNRSKLKWSEFKDDLQQETNY